MEFLIGLDFDANQFDEKASCLFVGSEEFWSAELELSSSCNDQGFILEQPLLECLFSWLFMHDYNKMALKK